MEADRASDTAYKVLQGMVHVAAQPATAHLVPAPKLQAIKMVLNSSDEGRKKLRQLQSPIVTAGLRTMERLFLPGISTHYVTRKLVIETMVRKAMAGGAAQVVNLGSGFDTLMYELSGEFPDLQFAEIDHPATFAEKRRAFDGSCPANLSLLPVDLSRVDVADAIRSIPNFDPTASTCFICEGVLMYLDITAIERLFAALSELCGAGTTFVFTAVPAMDSPNTNATWLLKTYLKYLGEPLNWDIESSQIADFVTRQGYEVHAVVDGPDMRARYLSELPNHPFHLGEFVVHSTVR